MPLIDNRTGARVALSRYGTFDLPFARDATGMDWAAYADLIGPHAGNALARVGWNYIGGFARVDALVQGTGPEPHLRVIASGWAGPIRAHDGAIGINISYGVGVHHRGAGLGRVLGYCAVAECLAHRVLAGETLPTFVNIQARAANSASVAVARSLGMPSCPEAGFRVPDRGRWVEYLGFREPIQDFLERGLDHALDRLPGYDPGSMAAARIGIDIDDGEILDLLPSSSCDHNGDRSAYETYAAFTASLSALPAVNFTTLLALIVMASPVDGLRPARSARSEIEKLPKPISCTASPLVSAPATCSSAESSARPASAFERLVSAEMAATSSALFI